MLSYRNLSNADYGFILQNWVGHSVVFRDGLCKDTLLSTLQVMNTKKYNGNYYEIFGLINDDTLVGTFSFYQREGDAQENAVYFGIEIDNANRGRGLATAAVQMAFELAKEKGFSKIFSQAAVGNIASVKLHEKCGFEIIEKTANSKGNEVYNFVRYL